MQVCKTTTWVYTDLWWVAERIDSRVQFTQVAIIRKLHAYTDDLRSTCVDLRWITKRWKTCVRIWARSKSAQVIPSGWPNENASWTHVENLRWLASPFVQDLKVDQNIIRKKLSLNKPMIWHPHPSSLTEKSLLLQKRTNGQGTRFPIWAPHPLAAILCAASSDKNRSHMLKWVSFPLKMLLICLPMTPALVCTFPITSVPLLASNP